MSTWGECMAIRRVCAALLTSALTVATLLMATPAASADPVVVTPTVQEDVSSQSVCSGYIGGHNAAWICEYGVTYAEWWSGRDHRFLVGTNNAVYNQLQYDNGTYSPWRSLGGQVFSGITAYSYSTFIEIEAIGGDGFLWCRALPYGGSWGSWHRC